MYVSCSPSPFFLFLFPKNTTAANSMMTMPISFPYLTHLRFRPSSHSHINFQSTNKAIPISSSRQIRTSSVLVILPTIGFYFTSLDNTLQAIMARPRKDLSGAAPKLVTDSELRMILAILKNNKSELNLDWAAVARDTNRKVNSAQVCPNKKSDHTISRTYLPTKTCKHYLANFMPSILFRKVTGCTYQVALSSSLSAALLECTQRPPEEGACPLRRHGSRHPERKDGHGSARFKRPWCQF